MVAGSHDLHDVDRTRSIQRKFQKFNLQERLEQLARLRGV